MFKISTETKTLLANLSNIEKQHLPFAVARALTKTAQEAQGVVRDEMRIEFDRPTPYTLRGIRVVPATKQRLFAELKLQDQGGRNRPSQYLRPNIEGGGRNLKGYERLLGNRFTVPGKDAPRDAYGNISGGTITRMLNDNGVLRGKTTERTPWEQKGSAQRLRDRKAKRAASGKPVYFIGAPGDGRTKGVWERRKIGKYWVTRPLLLFVDRPHYQPRFEWRYTIERTFKLRFKDHFEMSLRIAQATARKS